MRKLKISYGSGYCCDYGDGEGYGYGDGDGYGYGYGNGSGNSDDGSGYGDGTGCNAIELHIPRIAAWRAYHYVAKDSDGSYRLRDGRTVAIGEALIESDIKMCVSGLHAGLTEKNARRYRSDVINPVLTEVLIWGRVNLEKDKLVATNRMMVREIPESESDVLPV